MFVFGANHVADSTSSGASSYLAPTFTKLVPVPTITELVPDPKRAGAIDRLHYYTSTMLPSLKRTRNGRALPTWTGASDRLYVRDSTRAALLKDCTTRVRRSSYSALTLTKPVADPTWTGAIERLYVRDSTRAALLIDCTTTV